MPCLVPYLRKKASNGILVSITCIFVMFFLLLFFIASFLLLLYITRTAGLTCGGAGDAFACSASAGEELEGVPTSAQCMRTQM